MAFFMFYKEGKMKNLSVRNIVLAGFFLAVGIVLPFFTMQIPSIGNMLLPMHIPVLICGCLRVAVRINCWFYLTIA